MKYLEVTFTTHPCNETVNDVVSALAGEIGFESFVECEAGVQAYIQQTLFDEEALKEKVERICESDIILLIINSLLDVIEKQCTTVCTTFSALF